MCGFTRGLSQPRSLGGDGSKLAHPLTLRRLLILLYSQGQDKRNSYSSVQLGPREQDRPLSINLSQAPSRGRGTTLFTPSPESPLVAA